MSVRLPLLALALLLVVLMVSSCTEMRTQAPKNECLHFKVIKYDPARIYLALEERLRDHNFVWKDVCT